jgi:hypothetical protein
MPPEISTVNDRPYWAPPEIDLDKPSVCRVYDYFLGGIHNFAIDQETGDAALAALPGIPLIGRANRAVMERAVRFAADCGIRQFLDIGSGIPTMNNVHEVAQQAVPQARTVYVDNDPVAVAHSRAFLEHEERASIASADLRRPTSILDHPEVARLLDLREPVALLLIAVIHFLPDDDDPAAVIATLRDALAPGSLMVMTHARHGPSPVGQRKVQEIYARTSTPLILRDAEELRPLFSGFDIIDPGIVPMPHWRPDAEPPADDDPAVLHGLAGAGFIR